MSKKKDVLVEWLQGKIQAVGVLSLSGFFFWLVKTIMTFTMTNMEPLGILAITLAFGIYIVLGTLLGVAGGYKLLFGTWGPEDEE